MTDSVLALTQFPALLALLFEGQLVVVFSTSNHWSTSKVRLNNRIGSMQWRRGVIYDIVWCQATSVQSVSNCHSLTTLACVTLLHTTCHSTPHCHVSPNYVPLCVTSPHTIICHPSKYYYVPSHYTLLCVIPRPYYYVSPHYILLCVTPLCTVMCHAQSTILCVTWLYIIMCHPHHILFCPISLTSICIFLV